MRTPEVTARLRRRCRHRPAIDRVIGFDEVGTALAAMEAGHTFGKVAVRLD